MLLFKTGEERRNREYEISLVKALKNSYAGIEEIHISDPSYADIPSKSWGADVKFIFSDGKSVKHVLAYDKNTKEIRIGVYNDKDEEFKHILDSRRGQTKSRVKIKYSDSSEGKQ
ncbi:hypothetical protein [Streptococcus intermedius]|nr:hypothetical protein [Streptococcus intermedius]